MANLGNTTRPAYVYDAETDTWLPIGVGAHSHDQIPASIVDAKGDLIAGTAADTVQRRAVGADGSYLIADSTQTTGLNWAGPSTIAGKNLIINGGMDIWQRGTSFAISSSGVATYASDRWLNARNVAGQTVSRQATGDTTNLPFIQYCARVQRDSGNTNTAEPIRINQLLETVNSVPLAGSTVTLSFYARAGANFSAASSLLTAQVISGTGTDQNVLSGGYTGIAYPITSQVTLTTTWQRFSITGIIAATATELSVNIYHETVGTAGAADYFEITGVQLEKGSTATTFSRAGGTIQGELAACQRYYFRSTANAQYNPFGGFALSESTSQCLTMFTFPVTMRVKPTTLDYSSPRFYDVVSATAYSGGTVTLADATQNLGLTRYAHTSSPFTLGRMMITNNNSATGFYGFSAEL